MALSSAAWGADLSARPCAAWTPGRRPTLIPPLALQRRSHRAAAASPARSSSTRGLVLPLRAAAGEAQPRALPGDPAAEAAACLAAAGVDLAQLAREQPDAAAQLAGDLALARLLVAAIVARQGVKDRGRNLTPADLAARLAFLVAEAGLPAGEVERVYLRRPVNLHIRLDTARAALTWLRPHFPDPARLQRLGIHYPGLWHYSPASLEGGKAALQQLFGLSDAAWADAAYSNPALLSVRLDTVQRIVAWLRSPAVGMAEACVLRLFQRNPGFYRQGSDRLSARLEWLLVRLAVHRDEAAALVLKCSSAFSFSQHVLESRVAALEAYGFTTAQVGRLALQRPILLGLDFERNVQPCLAELERLLGPFGNHHEARRAVIDVVLRGPNLITKPPASLGRNFNFLLANGLTNEEACGLLREAPQVFARTLDGENMATKMRYYTEALGISAHDMLLKHRSYLKGGLEKVDRRVLCMERRGQLHQLLEGGTLAWTVYSPARFHVTFNISEAEWAACEAAWPFSERAQRYGLVGQQRQQGFNTDYRLASERVKDANARRSPRSRR